MKFNELLSKLNKQTVGQSSGQGSCSNYISSISKGRQATNTNIKRKSLNGFWIWFLGFAFSIFPFVIFSLAKAYTSQVSPFYNVFGVGDLFLTYVSLMVSPLCTFLLCKKITNKLGWSIVIGIVAVVCVGMYFCLGFTGCPDGTSWWTKLATILNIVFGLFVFVSSIIIYVITRE